MCASCRHSGRPRSLWSRFHERTQYLGYLKGGFHQLYIKLFEAVQKAGGQVWLESDVTAIRKGINEQEGKVIVRLSENPLQLRGWTIIDNRGNRVTVSLSDVQVGVQLADSLFKNDSGR